MRSIRTKITLMVIAAILAVAFLVSLLSVIFIRQTERRKSEQLLLLLQPSHLAQHRGGHPRDSQAPAWGRGAAFCPCNCFPYGPAWPSRFV